MNTHVSESAIIRRVNRKLRTNWQALRACPIASRGFQTLGRFYLLDTYRNLIVDTQLDIELFARELGVLHENEELAK